MKNIPGLQKQMNFRIIKTYAFLCMALSNLFAKVASFLSEHLSIMSNQLNLQSHRICLNFSNSRVSSITVSISTTSSASERAHSESSDSEGVTLSGRIPKEANKASSSVVARSSIASLIALTEFIQASTWWAFLAIFSKPNSFQA